jgi:hypothetical protein
MWNVMPLGCSHCWACSGAASMPSRTPRLVGRLPGNFSMSFSSSARAGGVSLTSEDHDRRSPATGIFAGQPERRDLRHLPQHGVHRLSQGPGPFPVDDAHLQDLPLPTGFQVLAHQVPYLGRSKGMEVQGPVDGYFDWIRTRIAHIAEVEVRLQGRYRDTASQFEITMNRLPFAT